MPPAKPQYDYQSIQGDLSTSVSFTSFMTAVTTFFVGIIIANFDANIVGVKVPIALMIIAIVGFLFSSILYTDATAAVSRHDMRVGHRYIHFGNVISEYFGVLLVVAAIPLTINVLVEDVFLRLLTITVCTGAMIIYEFSDLSMTTRLFSRRSNVLGIGLIAAIISLDVAQITGFYPLHLTIVFLGYIGLLAGISIRRPGMIEEYAITRKQ